MLDVLRRTKDPVRRLMVPLAALPALLAFAAAPASADVVRKTSAAPITIKDAVGGPSGADPFPSTITVAGQARAVVGVKVKLNDVTHGYAGDLDIALVGPNGHRVMLMSDSGGSSDLTSTDLTFDDEAADSVPATGDIAEGTYKPTDNDFGNATPDPFPEDSPQDYASRLDEFGGKTANGSWKLYVVDDSGGDAGQIGGWTLTLETGPTPAYNDQILISDDGTAPSPASPYAVPLEVSGVQGTIEELSVTLDGLRHDDPGDIDVMLESPNGKTMTLMSDAGGVNNVSNVWLRFADDAATPLSDSTQLSSGTYKPTNLQGLDNFPAPAPASADTTSLALFNGMDPNGTWKLWVVDDAGGAAGAIDNGYSLEMVVKPYVKYAQQSTSVGESAGPKTITVTRPEGGGAATVKYDMSNDSREYDVEATAGTLAFAVGQETKTFTVKPLHDTGDEPDEGVNMTLKQPTGDAQIKPDSSYYSVLVIEDDDAADVRGDFNGDGHEDIAAGVPGEGVGADAGAGAVNVIYGTASDSIASTGNQRFTQDSAGVPDATEPGDGFGTAVASGDFDSDGFSDLAVGVPGEELGAGTDSGAVTILYGGASGLTGTGSAMLGQDTAGVPNTSESGDRFGAALAAGNFGRTAHGDLAVGQPGEDVGAANGAGALTILYGSASGLGATGSQYLSQDVAGMPDTSESADAFGSVLAAGGLGSGAEDDLAVGVPGESQARGAVHVLYGRPANGLEAGLQLLTQDSPDVPDAAAAGDGFGGAVAITPYKPFGEGQLAIGAPQEDIGAAQDAGVVHTLPSSEGEGLRTAGSDLWDQSTGTMADSPEDGDRFGASLVWGELGSTGLPYKSGSKFSLSSDVDLAVGVPGETLGGVQEAGAAAVVYSADGVQGGDLSTSDNQLWHQGSAGVADTNHAGDHFGASLSAIRLGAGHALAAGIPGEASGAGAAAVLFRTPEGVLGSAGNKRFRQGSGGILDTAEAGDGFGSALVP